MVIFDGFSQQLPDIDPQETAEWVDSLEMVADERGRTRARFLLMKLLERARELGVGLPNTVSSPYINTIPPEKEPWFPGDEHIERRIRAFIRWNAAVMVSRANKRAKGIGGHLATYASAFIEGRLTEGQPDHFRQEIGAGPGGGLSSYPHPRLMPDFWEFPTVSMGLGPLAAIYQARFNRYLEHPGIKDTSEQ